MKRKIFIIEDDQYLTELTRDLLEKRGYEVVAYDNGEDATQRLDTELPDLIIIDNFLPGQSGLEFCEAVKTSETTRRIPLILTTGQISADELDAIKQGQFPPDECLIKPFDIEELLTKIKKLMPQS